MCKRKCHFYLGFVKGRDSLSSAGSDWFQYRLSVMLKRVWPCSDKALVRHVLDVVFVR